MLLLAAVAVLPSMSVAAAGWLRLLVLASVLLQVAATLPEVSSRCVPLYIVVSIFLPVCLLTLVEIEKWRLSF